MRKTCSRCRYWERTHPESDVGRCRRYPPDIAEVEATLEPEPYLVVLHDWPLTIANDHCGEFSSRTTTVVDLLTPTIN